MAVTLGLGIGATTAIFSVVDAILLRPLSFNDPEQLVTIWADYRGRNGPEREWLSYPNFHDLREQRDAFEEVSAWSGWNPTLTGLGNSEAITGAFVTYGMFSKVLGVTPVIGRGFVLEDDQPGAQNVILASHAFWSQRFGGDPEIIGTTISLADVPYTIIGVMPAGLRPPFVPDAEVWRTFQMNETEFVGGRGSARFRAFGRLMPDMTIDAARVRATQLGNRLAEEYPGPNTGVNYTVVPLKADLVRSTRAPLWVLLGAVTFVLLIACVNVANLLLARATVRETELALRAALGAGRMRLMRQLFTECIVLAAIGGFVGVGFAFLGTGFLTSIAPAGTPRIAEVTVDMRVLLFAAAATIAATFVFGLFPAMRGAHVDLHDALKIGGRGMGGGRTGLRAALVVGQVGLALVLLVGAGLMIRSLRAMNAVDLGFQTDRTLALQLNLPQTRYPDADARLTFFRSVEERLRALPGVEAVGAISSLPLAGQDGDTDFQIQGRPLPEPGKENVLWFRRATPDLFATMGMRVIEGRGIERRDDRDAPPVVVINETLARRQFPEGNALGQYLNVNSFEEPVWREIVGIAEDIKNFGIRTESRQAAYFPFYQLSTGFMNVVLRTAQEPTLLLPAVRGVVGELDQSLAVSNVTTMEDVVSASLDTERFVTALLTSFAGLAFGLSAVGLYGLVAYGVSQRVREMGVRIALGAGGRSIRRLIVGQSVLLAAIGVGAGLVGSVALTRVMAGLVFGVSTTDPLTLGTAAVLLIVVAAAAAALPAQRAVRVNPMAVLRQE
jgi:putative ABC transport system permease protein